MAEQKDKIKGTAKAEEKKTVAAKPAPKTVKAEVKPAKAETKSAKVEAKPAKAAAKPAVKPAPKAAPEKKPEELPAVVTPDVVYHISKRTEDRKWQVKAEGAAKALKLFWTQ